MKIALIPIIIFLFTPTLHAVDQKLLFGIEISKTTVYTNYQLYILSLKNQSKLAKGLVRLPINELIRPNIGTDRIAYYNRDSARTQNWIEVGHINTTNLNNEKQLLQSTKESEIKDFYWRDEDNLIIQISNYGYNSEATPWGKIELMRHIENSKVILYNIRTDDIDTLFTVDYDFELISSNTNFVYMLSNRFQGYNLNSGDFIQFGEYRPYDSWPNTKLEYVLNQPNASIITHFVRLKDSRTFPIPEHNDQFRAQLKSTEINDFGFRYDMNHINWSDSKAYYTFTPIDEPRVFINLNDNKYRIFEYSFKSERSKILFEMTLEEYFGIRFNPILIISDEQILARKQERGRIFYYFLGIKSKSESIVFETDYLGKVKIFTSEYARH